MSWTATWNVSTIVGQTLRIFNNDNTVLESHAGTPVVGRPSKHTATFATDAIGEHECEVVDGDDLTIWSGYIVIPSAGGEATVSSQKTPDTGLLLTSFLRKAVPGATNQYLVVRFVDTNGEDVAVDHTTPGLAIAWRADADGRQGTPVAMTPVARSSSGVHTDGAVTPVGDGYSEIDLPDAAFHSANTGKTITVIATATGVYKAFSERVQIEVPTTPETIRDYLASRHGGGHWDTAGGAGGPSGSAGGSNPAEGWEGRQGHAELVTITVLASGPNDVDFTFTIESAVRREANSVTSEAAGVVLTGDELVWNIPSRDLAGMALKSQDVIEDAEGVRHRIVGFASTETGVFGEEVRPLTRREV